MDGIDVTAGGNVLIDRGLVLTNWGMDEIERGATASADQIVDRNSGYAA